MILFIFLILNKFWNMHNLLIKICHLLQVGQTIARFAFFFQFSESWIDFHFIHPSIWYSYFLAFSFSSISFFDLMLFMNGDFMSSNLLLLHSKASLKLLFFPFSEDLKILDPFSFDWDYFIAFLVYGVSYICADCFILLMYFCFLA